MRKIAIVSEHASPLALTGSVDAGGQNVYVAHVARQLAQRGLEVDVYTRRESPDVPEDVAWQPGVRVIHVPAGPSRALPKEQLLPFMPTFSSYMANRFSRESRGYDLVHANFFMSAMASRPVARQFEVPLVITFHALGKVRRIHQREADLFPDSRFEIEDELVRHADRIVAECPQDRDDLIALYGADPGHVDIVPCGYDASEMGSMDRATARAATGCDFLSPDDPRFCVLQLGRMVPRKGVDNVIRSLATLRGHHRVNACLCIVGGNDRDPVNDRSIELARARNGFSGRFVCFPWRVRF